ncbi:MAG: pyridoxal phosphate-dependent aminotransferase [Lachnospiraceae bacterium]|nr:pyridoxal phosphate-dependent aminotransferase [Lachnospiraceae bacterium]
MNYDFDTVVSRRGTDACKWDIPEGELPMWIADMDFQTAPEIREAMQERLAHGIFGYSDIPDAWYEAYQSWWGRRHGLAIEKDWLIFCTGVVPAISSIVRKLTTPNENVVIQTPVYNIFFNSIINNGCRVLESPLTYENGAYTMDFVDLEEKLANPQTSLMILCNPHNPVGRIWSKEELARVGELAKKYHVTVISDEIHCDLTEPGKDYVPFASVSETCREVSITCIAPTKTFNIAGLQTAAVCVPDAFLRHKVWRGLNTDEVAEPNAFACVAAVAAFTKGEVWLDALREYLWENRKYAERFVKREIPAVKLVYAEATYLLWADVSALPGNSEEIADFLRKETGLYVSAGGHYGAAGDHFLRINVACPRALVEDGMQRLAEGVGRYLEA